MSEWFRIATVRVPKDKREQFLQVYRHHGWLVEDLRDETERGDRLKVWIPEGKVMEVRRVDGVKFLKQEV